MSRARCDHPATALLPWLINGTLEGEEEAHVKRHVSGCAVCSSEMALLSRISRHLDDDDVSPMTLPVPARSVGRSSRAGWAIAAGLAAPAALGLWWALLGFPAGGAARPANVGQAGPDTSIRSGFVFSLGGGALRGDSGGGPLVIPEGTDTVTITFTAPVDPEATYVVELWGPEDRRIGSREVTLVMDRMSRSAFTVAAESLGKPGPYRLAVRERHPGREDRTYLYPFIVEDGGRRTPD